MIVSVKFERERTITGGGRRWKLSCSIGFDPLDGVPEAVVMLHWRHRGDWRWSMLTPGLGTFARSVTRRLRRLGYQGDLGAEGLTTGVSGYFKKKLSDATSIEREIRVLDGLKFGR